MGWAVGGLVGSWASWAGAEPGVLYVPTEDVVLTPVSTPGCTSEVSSATGCTTGIDAMEVMPPYANAAALRDALAVALAPYDVHLATERPPEYLAYTMLLASDVADPDSTSATCSSGGIACGARKRNGIVRVFGPTPNCPVLDVPLASIYAFGRISGLEGVTDPLDAMRYIPDFTTQSGMFVDGCSARVQQIAFDDMGVGTPLPLECTSVDHHGCDPADQSSHADLLEYYGPRVVDEAPPVLSNLQPGDGAWIPEGDDMVLDVDIADADPVVGGRWTVVSPVFEDFGYEGGVITFCTNDACDFGWDDASPLKATDSDWSLEFTSLPAGIYEITFEASDFHGNLTAPAVMVAQIGGDPPPTTGTGTGPELDTGALDTGSLDTSGGGGFTTGPPPPPPPPPPGSDDAEVGPGEDSGSSDPEVDGDGLVPHGCVCTASGAGGRGGAWWLVIAVVLGLRRRWR